MNLLPVTLKEIKQEEMLYLLECTLKAYPLSILTLEAPPNLQPNQHLMVTIHPHHVEIFKGECPNFGHCNQLPATVQSIKKGKLLSQIKLQTLAINIDSLITTTACDRMNLSLQDQVTLSINPTLINLVEEKISC